jgi:hypothetical protein
MEHAADIQIVAVLLSERLTVKGTNVVCTITLGLIELLLAFGTSVIL